MSTSSYIFSPAQLNELRASYAQVGERISFEAADKILAMLDRTHPEAMQQLADAGIRFVSNAARGRILRAKAEAKARFSVVK